MTTRPTIALATDFIWRTARLLERRRFMHLFLKGEPLAVLEALRPYQNPDGGFGNGLEPDIRAPLSQPVPTWTALCIMDEAGVFEESMLKRICDYLPTITTPEGGVPFVLPSSVRDYPHAPWWEAEDHPAASLNPTAAIVALLQKHHITHAWLDTAIAYCWRKIEALDETNPYEMRAVLPFLDYVQDRERAEKAFALVGPKLLTQKLVTLAPSTQDETHTPLNFAPRPGSLARQLFADAVIETHLDALASAQQEDGGWSINWYAWNPAAALEWRGCVTIDALVTLRAYGRLE